jgi:hypothetical protein
VSSLTTPAKFLMDDDDDALTLLDSSVADCAAPTPANSPQGEGAPSMNCTSGANCAVGGGEMTPISLAFDDVKADSGDTNLSDIEFVHVN